MIKIFVLTLSLLFATATSAMGLDLCFYVNRAGDVLRLYPGSGTAVLSSAGNVELTCTLPIKPSPIPQNASCEDRHDKQFAVFTGASDQWLVDDDILVFKNNIWYRKCAFTR